MDADGNDRETPAKNGADLSKTQEAIMEATYRALCKHGVANLTIQAISDEFEKSKSLIFYHYNTKEDVLSSFLVYLLKRFKDRVAANDIDDPAEQLDNLINGLLFGPEDNKAFQTAMLELRSQAPFNSVYRKQFQTNRNYLHDYIDEIIEKGIHEGIFNDIDTSRVAAMLLTFTDGARTEFVVFGDEEVLEATREGISDWLDTTLSTVN